jgi:hypothetical protein
MNSRNQNPVAELPVVDIDEIRRVMEDYFERGWTDGLPVMPVTARCWPIS